MGRCILQVFVSENCSGRAPVWEVSLCVPLLAWKVCAGSSPVWEVSYLWFVAFDTKQSLRYDLESSQMFAPNKHLAADMLGLWLVLSVLGDASAMMSAPPPPPPPNWQGPDRFHGTVPVSDDDGDDEDSESDEPDIDLRTCPVKHGGCGQKSYMRKERCVNRKCSPVLICYANTKQQVYSTVHEPLCCLSSLFHKP